MRAKVIHLDLNPSGGAEYLALTTLKSLVDMGIETELAVAKEPNVARIAKSFGEEVYKIFDRIEIGALDKLPLKIDRESRKVVVQQVEKPDLKKYDMVINTHADILPYYLPSLKRYITYCHFPAAADRIKNHDMTYLNNLLDLGLLDRELVEEENVWDGLLQYYFLMLKGSLIVTNSKFSQGAIMKQLQESIASTRKIPTIISPPANVEEIRQTVSIAERREDSILVLSRIHPSKQIENAIELARILERRAIGKKMIIAGNLTPDNLCQIYYDNLKTMTRHYGLSDYISFMPSAHVREVRSFLQKSKVYFHPMQGEPFGISVVEAMAAGVVPIVPDIGGVTEFVPDMYQFRSLDEAADKIQSAMNAPNAERERISESARAFSTEKYEKDFALFIDKVILSSQEPNPTVRLAHRS